VKGIVLLELFHVLFAWMGFLVWVGIRGGRLWVGFRGAFVRCNGSFRV
jgi:hypothetical protein